jgi:cysteine desulfurase/selenocysteine lyase
LPTRPKDAGKIVALFEKALTPATRVISVSHVTYTTGLVLPVAELTKLARSRNVLMIVDGAQAVGAIDVDLKSIDADAYAASGHKWLLGPAGTGVLHIRGASRERIAPMPLASGPMIYTGAVGLRNLPGIIGLGAAIDWATAQGKERFARMLTMRNRACEALTKLGYAILSPPAGSPFASPMFTFAVDQPQKLADELLAKHGVVVRVVQHGKVSGLRVSMSAGNVDEDVDRLITSLRK